MALNPLYMRIKVKFSFRVGLGVVPSAGVGPVHYHKSKVGAAAHQGILKHPFYFLAMTLHLNTLLKV